MGRKRCRLSSLPGKHARDVAKAVIAAGGEVEVTSNGHLKITGPAGRAIIGVHRASYRGRAMAVTTARRHAGLELVL